MSTKDHPFQAIQTAGWGGKIRTASCEPRQDRRLCLDVTDPEQFCRERYEYLPCCILFPGLGEVEGLVATIEGVRELALSLPRSYEALVRDRVKFRVGRIVYLSFSRDETLMGFAFPKEEREALIASEPDKFIMPSLSDQRYNWVIVRLGAIDDVEMRELVVEAWRMVVPKSVAEAHLGGDLRRNDPASDA
jgi:hypothetical protein